MYVFIILYNSASVLSTGLYCIAIEKEMHQTTSENERSERTDMEIIGNIN